jgi:hypothetical protein
MRHLVNQIPGFKEPDWRSFLPCKNPNCLNAVSFWILGKNDLQSGDFQQGSSLTCPERFFGSFFAGTKKGHWFLEFLYVKSLPFFHSSKPDREINRYHILICLFHYVKYFGSAKKTKS